MHTPVALLKSIGRALVSTVGAELAGDTVVDALPEVVKQVWASWSPQSDEGQRRAEVEALVQASAELIREAVDVAVREVAADQPAGVRQALTEYLNQIPGTMRHTLRRPADPAGTTVPPRMPLRQAENLLPYLPVRLPRFKVGDAPLPGVDWRLVELLGVGGFGEVWKARNPNAAGAPPVALKFCHDPFSAKVLRNEAKLLDRLMMHGKHPGIVPLRQTYLTTDPPCLEYDYIPGGDLAGLIHESHWHKQGPTSQQVALFMLRLSKIMAFTHRLDPPIVHRDLKPANILVQRLPNGKLDLRIADFGNGGVAASQAIRQTLRGTSQARMVVAAVRGACTPLYASPQQMRGSDADPRDDIYALGMIWYQFLTGDLSACRPGGSRWPRRLADQGMAAPLVDLLGSCFADNPDDRPRSAGVLADRLSALLQGDEEESAAPIASLADAAAAALPKRVTNSLSMSLTLIPAGTGRIGSPPTETDRGNDEGPQHEITFTRPFYMGIYPVTQRQYETVMGTNPSYYNAGKGGGTDFPVERVSWDDAMAFCAKLSALPAEKQAGRVYRLPTEAEWEYACRAGLPTPFPSGVVLTSREANFNGNYPYGIASKGPYLERTSKVGSYPPNPFGLYDMHGNVWEWCSDYYDRNYYRNSPRYDPPGPPTGTLRVVRGGSCFNIGRFCRASYRFGVAPGNRDLDVGLRLVMIQENPQVEITNDAATPAPGMGE